METTESYKGGAIVAFLDILGYGSYIEDQWADDSERVIVVMRGLSGFGELDGGLGGVIRSGTGAQLTAYVRVVSDSVLVCFPLPDRAHFAGAMITVARTVAWVWGWLLDKGLTLRGGIELGDAYWDRVTLTGPAPLAAYAIESKVASSSRVVLGDTLVQACVTQLPKYAFEEAHRDGVMETVAEGHDGLLVLDPKLTVDLWEDVTLDKVKQDARILLDRNPNYRAKYEPLLGLLDGRKGITWERFVEIAGAYPTC